MHADRERERERKRENTQFLLNPFRSSMTRNSVVHN